MFVYFLDAMTIFLDIKPLNKADVVGGGGLNFRILYPRSDLVLRNRPARKFKVIWFDFSKLQACALISLCEV